MVRDGLKRWEWTYSKSDWLGCRRGNEEDTGEFVREFDLEGRRCFDWGIYVLAVSVAMAMWLWW